MLHQMQPNEWSCLLTSFAMCIDVSIENIMEYLGHDGSEIIYPNLPEPYCRRSFHPQELIDYCYLVQNKWVMQIEKEVQLINCVNEAVYTIPLDERRIRSYIETSDKFVMSGVILNNNRRHAVACVDGVIYDPNGTKKQLITFFGNFNIETLFLFLT